METTLKIAHQWLEIGVATIPILFGSKRPALDWRTYQTRLPTKHELCAWFGCSRYNLAVVCGWQGLAVVDFDDLLAYSRWLAALDFTQAAIALTTYRVKTARGLHLYFFSAEETHNKCRPSAQGYDVRGAGGYVIAPPSTHPSGAVYEAIGRIEDIQHVNSLRDLLPGLEWNEPQADFHPKTEDDFDVALHGAPSEKYARAALDGEVQRVATAANGTRNHTLNAAAFALARFVMDGSLSSSDIEHELERAAHNCGLSQHEARRTIASGLRGRKNGNI